MEQAAAFTSGQSSPFVAEMLIAISTSPAMSLCWRHLLNGRRTDMHDLILRGYQAGRRCWPLILDLYCRRVLKDSGCASLLWCKLLSHLRCPRFTACALDVWIAAMGGWFLSLSPKISFVQSRSLHQVLQHVCVFFPSPFTAPIWTISSHSALSVSSVRGLDGKRESTEWNLLGNT